MKDALYALLEDKKLYFVFVHLTRGYIHEKQTLYSCLFFIDRVEPSNFVSLCVYQGTHRLTSDDITCLFWQRQQLLNFINTF